MRAMRRAPESQRFDEEELEQYLPFTDLLAYYRIAESELRDSPPGNSKPPRQMRASCYCDKSFLTPQPDASTSRMATARLIP